MVIASPLVLRDQVYMAWLPESERTAWDKFHRELVVTYKQFYQAYSSEFYPMGEAPGVFTFSWPRLGSKDTDSLNPLGKAIRFFALITEKPDKHSYIHIFLY